MHTQTNNMKSYEPLNISHVASYLHGTLAEPVSLSRKLASVHTKEGMNYNLEKLLQYITY